MTPFNVFTLGWDEADLTDFTLFRKHRFVLNYQVDLCTGDRY